MISATRYETIPIDSAKDREDRVLEGIASWGAFYRANPHRLPKDYLGITLKPFQQINLLEMDRGVHSVYIASRGQGKSFLIAVFCCVRCILYPGTKICIAAGVRSQSINILEYIRSFASRSKNLTKEIDGDVTITASKAECIFKNGSYVKVVTAKDSARGNRATIVICDEFRMIPEDVIITVLTKFLSDERHPPYRDNPKYANFMERNKQIYLSSAWFKDHWSYKKVATYYSHMVSGDPYFVCGLPYQLAIKEGLYRREQAIEEMSEATFNESQWRREMECEWTGDTEGAFYNFESINRTRKLKYPILPNILSSRFGGKLFTSTSKKVGEVRILSADIALMRSSKKVENDASAYFLNQMIPNAHGRYYHNFVYTESHEGETTQRQALRLRRLYDEFDVDYLVIDGKGAGAGIVDLLLDDIFDPDFGVTYGALSCCNNSELAARCTDPEAPKALWVINNQTARFNSESAFLLREGFRSGKIRLLMSEYDADEVLADIRGWGALNPIEKDLYRRPYIETTQLVDELINLKYEDTQNGVRIYERSGYRKDRYSSISYNYWVGCQLEDRARAKRRSAFSVEELLQCCRAPVTK